MQQVPFIGFAADSFEYIKAYAVERDKGDVRQKALGLIAGIATALAEQVGTIQTANDIRSIAGSLMMQPGMFDPIKLTPPPMISDKIAVAAQALVDLLDVLQPDDAREGDTLDERGEAGDEGTM